MSFQNAETQVRWYRHPLRMALLAVIMLSAIALFVKPSKATIGVISKADLYGNWQATYVGFTGCGQASGLADISLNGSGMGTATLQSHGQCGDVTGPQTLNIISLNSNGSGTAGLTCGTGCGWTFAIQVAPDRSSFNMVDVTDPGNFLEGTAIHQ
jgi:hypothetical protein